MTRVLVTGAAGFIGSHLIPGLRIAGHEVIAVDAEAGDVAEASTWAAYQDAEAVVHLAARSFVPESWRSPASFIETNVVGTVRALDYCVARQARLVILSSYLYGEPDTLPVPETAPPRPHNPYALSKKMAEDACRFYSDLHGVRVVILRPFNVYGPGQRGDFLIPSIILQTRKGDTIRVKDLEPRRDYVYVGDLAGAIVKAVGCGERFTVLNIGSGVSYSVAEVIELIQSAGGTRLPVISEGVRRQGEVMDSIASITRAADVLDWKPLVGLADGLRRTLSYHDNEDEWRDLPKITPEAK